MSVGKLVASNLNAPSLIDRILQESRQVLSCFSEYKRLILPAFLEDQRAIWSNLILYNTVYLLSHLRMLLVLN